MFKKLSQGHWPIFLLSSLSSFGNLFLPIILVRLLSPEDIGVYKTFFIHLATIPYLIMAGGPIYSIYYWSGKDPEEREKYLNATWILALILSALVLLVGLPFINLFAGTLDMPLNFVFILFMTASLMTPASHYSETSIANGRQTKGSLFSTFFEVIKVIGFVIIAWKFKSLEMLFWFYLAIVVVKFALGLMLNSKENKISFNFDSGYIKNVLVYALPISFSGCLGFFIDKIDLLLLSSLLDPASFAFYSMGCLVIPPLYLLEMSVQKVLIPNLSKSYNKQNWKEGASHFRKAISDISFLMIPAIFGLITFAKPIVTILYTDKYLDSVIYLQIFAFSYLLLIIPHDSVARATGKTGWILKMYLFVTPISLAAAYFTAKNFGAVGVLVGTLSIKFLPKFFGLGFSKKLMNWEWKDILPGKRLGFYTGLSLVLSVISVIVRPLFVTDTMWFIVCGGMFAVLYLSLTHLCSSQGSSQFLEKLLARTKMISFNPMK